MRCVSAFLAYLFVSLVLRAELSVLVLGDWGRGGFYGQREVAEEMGKLGAEHGSACVISLGDNFYEDGVKSVTDERWQKSFERVYTAKSLQVPWYAVLGNHDYLGNVQAQIDYSKTSPRWRMPARYFTWTQTVEAGVEVQFFALDTNPLQSSMTGAKSKRYGDIDQQDPELQYAWLEKELAASKARWKIVFGHHPVYTAGMLHKDSPDLIKRLKPLLEKYGVQAYLAGHEHDQQHLRDEGPVEYFVTGAGSEVRGTKRGPKTIWSRGDVAGFMELRFGRNLLQARFLDMFGNERHKVEVR